jgi:DNA-binding LacI/PurR family transcriptional regulator
VAACSRLGIGPEPGLVARMRWDAGDDPAPTERAIRAGATALIVPFQHCLPGVREALGRCGLGLRGDFGLVAWGTSRGVWSEEEHPTHVTWSAAQMGREAVRRLLARIVRPDLEPSTVVIPTTLVDRGTGGRGPGAARELR